MHLEFNKSLREYNSFGFDVQAEFFTSVNSIDSLTEALEWCRKHKHESFILGGGSNTLFTRHVRGLVCHIAITGFNSQSDQPDKTVNIHAGAGVNWHQLVIDTLDKNYFGLENLALIPGSAGAAPIQNIGAYGTEVSDRLTSVVVMNRFTSEQSVLDSTDCHFAYRHSFFKTATGSEYIVTGINLQLSLEDQPKPDYQALQQHLHRRGIEHPTGRQVFDSVCEIRQSKLPDPARLGNAGSFFKNPSINRRQLDAILAEHPEIPSFQQAKDQFKVPAAWLIDRAGWKGYRSGPVGVHSAQALVLVNHGGGDGQQIATLALQIKKDIEHKFGVTLEQEPVVY